MMSDKPGFIFLHRKLLDSVVWKLSTSEQRSILIAILLLASHKPNKWEWQGKEFMVNPGQFVTSAKSLCEASGNGISRQNVRTALARFEKLGFLTTKLTRSGSLISIIKWGDYQNRNGQPNQEGNQRVTKGSPRGNQGVTTINNVNNKDNVNNEKNKAQNKAFSLPDSEMLKEGAEPKILSDIEMVCKKLYDEKIFPKVHAFKNTMLKKNKNPRAILHVLSRCYLKKKFESGPWAYCIKIMGVENGNYNESDYVKTAH